MASRKQIENKIAKLGGYLLVDKGQGYAQLCMPNGYMLGDYHIWSDTFDDGAQSVWDLFHSAMKNNELVKCECCE